MRSTINSSGNFRSDSDSNRQATTASITTPAVEEEENNQLAFLDVLVCRKDCSGLKTKVFRKATNTTQILNFNSNHSISHKRNCVRALYRRVETHCSEMEDKVAELQYLRRVMRANGYPRNFVNQCIRKGHQRPNPTGPKFWRALPYVKNVSEAVSRLLTPLGVGVAHRPEATIRSQIMRPKDPLSRQETSGVVYRIWCSCGQSNYVGETGRLLRTRIAEHAAAVRRGDANCLVAAHSTGPGHIFKFQEAEILARGDNRVSRELLESWFSGPQSINKHNDLPVPYSVLRFSLGRRISHVGRTRASNHHGDSEPVCRAIVRPASSTDDEIAAINDSDSDRQATTASITTPAINSAIVRIQICALQPVNFKTTNNLVNLRVKQALPNPPSAYAGAINSTSVWLAWEEPGNTELLSTLYAIVTKPNYPQVHKTREMTIEIPNLQPSTEYTFHVYAISDTGAYILPGAEAKAKTWDGVEVNPSELKTVHLDFYGIRLVWKAVNYSERAKPLQYSHPHDGLPPPAGQVVSPPFPYEQQNRTEDLPLILLGIHPALKSVLQLNW
ncbi:hypothetical protein SprV_0802630600 [Sparganum proliferum]